MCERCSGYVWDLLTVFECVLGVLGAYACVWGVFCGVGDV